MKRLALILLAVSALLAGLQVGLWLAGNEADSDKPVDAAAQLGEGGTP